MIPFRSIGPALALAALFAFAPGGRAAAAAERDSFVLGVVALRAERLDAADRLFRAAAAAPDAPHDWLRWFRAALALRRGDTAAALTRLEEIGHPRLRVEAAILGARIETDAARRYAVIGRLLQFGADQRFGGRALHHAAKLLDATGDTPAAERVRADLVAWHPASPFAHRAALSLLDDPAAPGRSSPWALLRMAQAARAAEDHVTAHAILEALARRRVDRRIRDDILLLHGDVLFRLSRYGEALVAYREAWSLATEAASAEEAELGMTLCRLYLGDSVSRAIAVERLRARQLPPRLAARLETIVGVKRVQGDHAAARELLSLFPTPVFEHFLEAWREPRAAATERRLIGLAERLAAPEERALAHALLAERETGAAAADLWRRVLFESGHEALHVIANAGLARIETAPPDAARRAAAEELLDAAYRAIIEDRGELALRQLRVIIRGHPATPAVAPARRLRDRLLAPHWRAAAATPEFRVALSLHRAGAHAEAADELELAPDAALEPGAALLRIEALDRAGRHHLAIEELERFLAAMPDGGSDAELAETFAAILHPVIHAELFRSVADSHRLEPAALLAYCRVATRLDPSFHRGHRLGLGAVDLEVLAFARAFPDAPRLAPADLLVPERALEMTAWLWRTLAERGGETAPLRVAGALLVGPGLLPAEKGLSDLEWIAAIPFQEKRARLLDFMVALERYRALLPARVAAPRPRPTGGRR